MKKVVVLTPADARHGFALSGVLQRTLVAAQLPAQLHELIADPVLGLIIVDERLVAGATQAQLRDLERRWPGLIVILPAPEAVARLEEDYVLRLIRRAIGYQVRLGA